MWWMLDSFNNTMSDSVIFPIFFFVTCRRRFDFQSPSRMDRNVELFLNMEKALREVNVQSSGMIIQLFLCQDSFQSLPFFSDFSIVVVFIRLNF